MFINDFISDVFLVLLVTIFLIAKMKIVKTIVWKVCWFSLGFVLNRFFAIWYLFWEYFYFEKIIYNYYALKKNGNNMLLHSKGQLISKWFFGIIDFLQKTNENTSHTSKNEFIRSFFGRILGLTIFFEINWPLILLSKIFSME